MSAFHSRTVPSSAGAGQRCPSGLNATLYTASVWPVSGSPTGWPVSASHSRTVLSSLAVASRCPSGLNATRSPPVWPVSGADRLAGVGVPQPHRVSSLRSPGRPSGLNATPFTAVGVPVSGSPSGWPVAASHSRTVPSDRGGEPVPSGLNATPNTGAGVAVERVAEWVGRCRRPTAAPCCRAGAGQPVSVGAERHAAHPSVWPVSGAPMGWPVSAFHSRTVSSVPGGGQPVPVGAERHAVHRAGVAGERLPIGLAGVGVPQPHRVVGRRRWPAGARRG